jgi:glycosyltransferase involved in cell wall biosynthesis
VLDGKAAEGKRGRAALFANRFLPYSQTFIFDELRHHQRYDVEVFCQRRLNEDRFPYERVHAAESGAGLGGKLEGWMYQGLCMSPGMLAKLRRGNFDLLHAHFGTGCIRALPAQAALGVPLISTFHGYDVPLLLTRRRFRPKWWQYWGMSKWMLNSVDRFLAASEELAELLLELGAPRDRVKVWRLGIELPPRTEPSSGPLRKIMMVGRFVEKKGFVYGLEAFCRVAADHADIALEIVGDGKLRPEYDAILARHGCAERVSFAGVLQHAQVLEAMADADLLIAPSVIADNGDRESGLIVVKEAAARSVPTIGTYHGGIPEIIDDAKTGYLVSERDADAIEDRLRRLLADPGLRTKMGGAAREKMEAEYDIADRVAALENHYDEVLAMRARSKAG